MYVPMVDLGWSVQKVAFGKVAKSSKMSCGMFVYRNVIMYVLPI